MSKSILIVFLVFCINNARGPDTSKTQFMNQPWKMHHIDRQFWNHNSLSPGDVDKDGLTDSFQGEKWDHMRFVDLDKDGDLDIVGNCEEYYQKEGSDRNTLLGVVWFENPTINP